MLGWVTAGAPRYVGRRAHTSGAPCSSGAGHDMLATMSAWDPAFEARGRALVAAICDDTAAAAPRDAAWRALAAAIAPHVERWAASSSLLRRWRLVGEDEARAVLVGVLERLSQRRVENLRGFLARRPGAGTEEEAELEALRVLSRVAEEPDGEGAVAPDPVAAAGAADEARGTPLRAWLITLVGFVEKDHVKQRLGWRSVGDGGPDKRSLGTDATRLDDAPEPGARPPITDLLAMRQVLAEARATAAGFPERMRRALELWMDDESFDAIARTLALADAHAARSEVRAAQARLRHHLRRVFPTFAGQARDPL